MVGATTDRTGPSSGVVPHPCQNTHALRVTGGHSGNIRRHSDLDSGCYQSCLNKPDKDEVDGSSHLAHRGEAAAVTARGPRLVPGDMRLILPDARLEPVPAADALQPGRNVMVIPKRIVATIPADDLKHAGVDAFRLALDNPDLPLAPQHYRPVD